MGRQQPSSFRLEFIDADTNVRIVKFVATRAEVDQFAQLGYAFEVVALYENPDADRIAHDNALDEAAQLCEALAAQAAPQDYETVRSLLIRTATTIRALKHNDDPTSH